MRGYFGLGQLSPSEKSDILDQHRQIYNGYKTMLPQVSNTQPLYTQDYANDKNGITVNNKGEVKHYTNFGINESVFGNLLEINEGDGDSEMCECGGMMDEGVCNECGSSYMEEETGHLDDIKNVEDFDPTAGFDYIEGPSNDVDTFEGMHKKLSEDDDSAFDFESEGPDEFGNGTYSDTANDMDLDKDKEFEKFNFEPEGPGMGNSYPVTMGNSYSVSEDMEDDEIEKWRDNDIDMDDDKIERLRDKDVDMDDDKIERLRDKDVDMDDDKIERLRDKDVDMWVSYTETKEGNNMDRPEITYDTMESAWMDEELDEEESFDNLINMDSNIESERDNLEQMESALEDEELDEVDVSGSQGIYADMKPAYDFDSGGAGPAGPYQRRNEHEFRPNVDLGKSFEKFKNKISNRELGDNDFEPKEKSWEEITDYTNDDEFDEVDDDIKESLIIQKNRIMEMMNRMNNVK